jgi:universal stress protein E
MVEQDRHFSDIFVIIDPTRMVQTALLRAEAIAALNGAHLTLYCCVSGDASNGERDRMESRIQQTREWIKRIAERPRALGIDVDIEVEWGTNWRQALVDASRRSGADLIVKESSKHSVVGRMFSATADWMLLSQSTAPVMLISDAARKTDRKLLAAIKLKPEDEEQVAMNREIVDLSHYISDVAGFEMHAATVYRGEDIYFDRQQFADACRIPRNRVHAMEGAPHHAIAAAADEIEADTIVIGNPAKSETAQRLIDHVHADILVLPTWAQ